jgi:hypothetical protein
VTPATGPQLRRDSRRLLTRDPSIRHPPCWPLITSLSASGEEARSKGSDRDAAIAPIGLSLPT